VDKQRPNPAPDTSPTQGTPLTTPSTAGSEKVAASLENWKRKLLDLSKRNRALNFKMSKVSTIAIVDEQPAEVFRYLYLRERAMRFKAAPESDEQAVLIENDPSSTTPTNSTVGDNETNSNARHGQLRLDDADPQPGHDQPRLDNPNPIDTPSKSQSDDTSEPSHLADEDEDDSLNLDFAPYDPSSLEQRYTDDWLQTASTPEALDKSLRRIDEQARLAIDEQGVNTLFLALGLLHYTESSESEQIFKAPLVLLPVELSRRTARSGYQVRATDDDPIVNPALVEYLKAQGISLPELPESNAMPEDYDLQALFSETAQLISDKRGWGIKTDIYLGLFSFQKFVMYKDLETHGEDFADHRLIRQLILHSGGQIAGLPSDIRSMTLDDQFPPESTFQVVDADSSQLRAIAACARNHDVVIEGPPGTGKSQTITNLIAQALAADKSVLFVAEKMAALEVVHGRLVQAGLGEACLELHSTKANKRTVMKELAMSLDASLQKFAAPTASTQRLPHVRATLSDYVKAVHTPFGVLGIAPYSACGALGRVLAAPRLQFNGPVEALSSDQLDHTVRELQDLAAASTVIGNPSEHPWRDAHKTFYSEDDLLSVEQLARDLGARLAELQKQATVVQAALHLPEIRSFADIDTVANIAEVMKRSPGAPLAVLQNDAWNRPPAEATALLERGRELERLNERVKTKFSDEVLGQDHASDIAYIEQKSQGILSLLASFDGRYRSIKKRWLSYRLPSFAGSIVDQANDMKNVDRLRSERAAFAGLDTRGRQLFGELWQGQRSDWNGIESYIRWVVEFRGLCVRHSLQSSVLELASAVQPNLSDIDALVIIDKTAREALARLGAAVGWPDRYLCEATLQEIEARAESIASNIKRGPQWAAFESTRQTAEQGTAHEMLPNAMTGQVGFRDLASAFLRAFYMKWLSLVVQQREPLARFHTLTHEERVAEFKRLDQLVLRENRAALVSQLRDRVQQRLQRPDIAAKSLPFLRKQMALQRGHAPLRRTMQQSASAIRAIKPCFMMSPLTVAQLLDGSEPTFDLIIFDEASQIPPEDAVGAIARGKQLVVVGDPKQLPPTNFFSVTGGLVNAPLSEDGTPIFEDSESILENFMGAGVGMSRLKWHYRSTHESLINFSNVSFYESDLYTFPSIETGTNRFGLQFEYVADGVYEGKGMNRVEAQRVTDAVVRFAKLQLDRQQRGESTQSLGVGTFNMRQQLAIQDELEQRRRDDPGIEPFFARNTAEPFFVKNLENIQGDERDVIFISVTYAKAQDGKLRYNFGPLNSENGWRRLNVLVTRARQCMRVYSSMRGDEINPAATASAGPGLLRTFLQYAEHGRLDSPVAKAKAETESPLERDVLAELTSRGVSVVPQVGVTGYRIDLGILDDATPGRFLCGIECDGVAYHESETARDRDRLRQQVLEARGWTIHRLWSTDWFKDRHGQIERLLSLIEEDRSRAREEAAAEQQARERVMLEGAALKSEEAEKVQMEGAERHAETIGIAEYERPRAAPYVTTPGEGRYEDRDFHTATLGDLTKAIVGVVETESPVHRIDVIARVAAMWGLRVGSRIQARIIQACDHAEGGKLIDRRDDFYWSVSCLGKCVFRSRAGTKISGDRIAPEEYQEAILAVLEQGHAFARPQLVNEVRSVFGFSRTGAVLDEAINSAISALLARGELGEGSTGVKKKG
jgi:very-short-patch-repair endonuclease